MSACEICIHRGNGAGCASIECQEPARVISRKAKAFAVLAGAFLVLVLIGTAHREAYRRANPVFTHKQVMEFIK